jgi:hypothetical protein
MLGSEAMKGEKGRDMHCGHLTANCSPLISTNIDYRIDSAQMNQSPPSRS